MGCVISKVGSSVGSPAFPNGLRRAQEDIKIEMGRQLEISDTYGQETEDRQYSQMKYRLLTEQVETN